MILLYAIVWISAYDNLRSPPHESKEARSPLPSQPVEIWQRVKSTRGLFGYPVLFETNLGHLQGQAESQEKRVRCQ